MTLLISFLLLFPPVQVEHGRFNIIKDGNPIGTEEFDIARRGAKYAIDGKTTLNGLTLTSQMELDDKLVPLSYVVSNKEGSLRVKVASPTSELTSIVREETASADFRFPERGVILDNNFFHHYVVLLYRAQMGETNFGVFVPQDMRIGSAVVRSAGPHAFDLEVGDVKMHATTDADGRLIKLEVPAANVIVQR